MKTGNFPLIEFENIFKLNPQKSSWVCFYEVVVGRNNISKRTLKKYFNKLIDKNDYSQNEKHQLINYLYDLTGKKQDRVCQKHLLATNKISINKPVGERERGELMKSMSLSISGSK